MKGISEFKLEQARVTDEYFDNSLQKEVAYLLSLDEDRLLAGFRETAGMDMKGKMRYGGQWEDGLIGGHTIGHYMTAVAQAIANPGTTDEARTVLTNKLNYTVDSLKECQEKTGTGFIFGARIINNSNIEQQFDNVEAYKTNIITQAWVPWYTMHKIIAGLVDVYKYTGYENAKTVASSLGDWTYQRTSKWDEALQQKVLSIEYGGMNDCMYELYKITQNENHKTSAHMFDEVTLFENVLANQINVLNNKHANTTIPKFLGALNRYRVTEEEKYLQYAEAFWQMVIDKHTYVTGGNSEWEHFGDDYVLDVERTNCNCETCNTYNMLKYSRELFKITGNKKYSDYYESTLINAIMSSQNPETGMSMYFQPMATGYFKVYGSRTDHFWCCTGSGMENFTKLNDSIYFYKDKTIFVNQYRSSELTWADENIKITQTADLLTSETVTFMVSTIDGSANVGVSLRFKVPDWAAGNLVIKVDNVEHNVTVADGYTVVSGPIKNGAVIDITIPMTIRAHNLPDAENTYAFKYGPILLSAELGTDDLLSSTTGVNVLIPSTKKVISEKIRIDNTAAKTVAEFMENISNYLVRQNDTFEFILNSTNQTLTFSPHYMQHTQRYGIYWKFSTDSEGMEAAEILAENEKERFEAAKLDTVQPGYGQYETDHLHDMEEDGSVGNTSDGTSRYAEAGGKFSYRMLINELGSTSLKCTFDRKDNGKSIKISIGKTVIYMETLDNQEAKRYYDVNIKIPDEVIAANIVNVNYDGNTCGAVRIVFESAVAGESSAKLCNYAYTLKADSAEAVFN